MEHSVKSSATLIDFLSSCYPESSKNTLRGWIQQGRVSAKGVRLDRANIPVKSGDTIRIGPKTRVVQGGIKILFEDNDLIAIDKPAGVLSVATRMEKEETAFRYLKDKYAPYPIYVVHRLDRETSGVMLFARSKKGCEALKQLFAKHTIKREYVALVEGVPNPSKGTWESYLWEDGNYRVHSTDDSEGGEQAITRYKVTQQGAKHSLLTLFLETGKKNQIRVHCQQAGCPVAGDRKYGAKTNPLKRLGLHAHLLAFKHPITHKEVRFLSPIPKGFYDASQ
ncbi:MAG: RluA family pseudouridine synthase [Chlamydiia bacterium]|nr:RluA family pseudouridine synthase [Chlamydiia bacterium]